MYIFLYCLKNQKSSLWWSKSIGTAILWIKFLINISVIIFEFLSDWVKQLHLIFSASNDVSETCTSNGSRGDKGYRHTHRIDVGKNNELSLYKQKYKK